MTRTSRRLNSRQRLTINIALGLLVMFLVGGFVIVSWTTRDLERRVDEELINVDASSARGFELLPSDVVTRIAGDINVGTRRDAIILLRADGTVVSLPAGNADNPEPLPDLSGYDVAELRRRAGVPFTVDDVAGGHDRYRLVTVQLSDGSVAIAARPLDELRDAIAAIVRVLLGGFIVLTAGVAVLVWLVSRHALKPLEDVIATAEATEYDSLSTRVAITSNAPDVERLAHALNGMLARIERSAADQERSEQRLRQFVADASHELRTPLAAILGYAELYHDGIATGPEQVDHAMTRITTEGSRMQRLVEDLLLLARLDEGRPLHLEDVDLCGVAAESVGVARAVDRERAFEIAPGCSPITVRADASALRQVVDNLLGNVTAHTPAGTSAVVAVHQDGRHAMLSVSDDGPGLPTDGFGRAFDRFWRAEQSRIRPGGSGLGLAIVRELVAAHGGTVTAGASPRGGLSVEVSLPLAPAPPPARGA